MITRILLASALVLFAFPLAAPVALAGSCNIFYDASPYVCVSLDPGTTSEPGVCTSSPGAHCGSPCVLSECVTQETTFAECLTVESSLTDSTAFRGVCLPVCFDCVEEGSAVLP